MSKITSKTDNVNIRMYRAGTGDCFLLQFKSKNKVICNVMIDCGCILAGRSDFEPWLMDINAVTGGKIDILVVTHEHADHINGFKACSDLFDKIKFKKVWFAWTEDETDSFANYLRENHSKLKIALQKASLQLKGLVDNKYYETLFEEEYHTEFMLEGKKHFITSLEQLNSLNLNNSLAASGKMPSMVSLFTDFKVIKKETEVEFLHPGDLLERIPELPGLRVFVLGPPRDNDLLNATEKHGEHYAKREKPSNKDQAFAAAILGDSNGTEHIPFESEYELSDTASAVQGKYDKDNWRNIDHDWLYASGSIALRHERSINNTSLALAFQFTGSERVLLFPGDAEYGNWKSWHDLSWKVKFNEIYKQVNAEYLLNKTVFYKIGHHCSQNGTASKLGSDMMTSEELTVMAPLNFKKIQKGWLNTMPNDLLCASLIAKSQGKFYFSGELKQMMPNLKTKRVTIKESHEIMMTKLNKKSGNDVFVECELKD